MRWFEEPVSSDDLDGLREVRDAVQADVTAGEYGYDLTYFRRMCAAGAVDCLQADVSRCGGITEWLRAAAVAASYGLRDLRSLRAAPARGRAAAVPTCGTWNGSTTTCASRPCSSTAPSTRPAELSGPTRTPPGWDLRCGPPMRNATGPSDAP